MTPARASLQWFLAHFGYCILLGVCQIASFGTIKWLSAEEAQWLILVSTFSGVLVALVAGGFTIARRYRMRLQMLLLMAAAFGALMLSVNQLLFWMSNGKLTSGSPSGTALLLLAITILAILVHSSAMLLRKSKESGYADPPLWMLPVYWFAVPCVWFGFLAIVLLNVLPSGEAYANYASVRSGAWWVASVSVMILLTRLWLEVRWFRCVWKAAKHWRDIDIPASHALWLLVGFVLACTRVQQGIFVDAFKGTQERYAKALETAYGPKPESVNNARTFYDPINIKLVNSMKFEYASDEWNTPAAHAFLSLHSSDLLVLQGGNDRPYYSISLEQPGQLPNLLGVRASTILLLLKARHLAADGEYEKARAYFEDAFRFARNYTNCSPSILENMIGIAVESDTLTAVLSSCLWYEGKPPSDTVLKQAQALIRKYRVPQRPDFKNACLGEEAYIWRNMLQRSSHAGLEWPGVADPVRSIDRQAIFDLVRLELVTRNLELSAYCSGRPVDWKNVYTQLKNANESNFLTKDVHITPHSCRAGMERDAEFIMVDVGLSAKRYQLKYGAWPKTLEACVPEFLPEVPEDPWQPGAKLNYGLEPARIFTAALNGSYHWDKNSSIVASTDCLSMSIFSWNEQEGSVLFLERGKAELEFIEQDKKRREEAEKNAAGAVPNGTSPAP